MQKPVKSSRLTAVTGEKRYPSLAVKLHYKTSKMVPNDSNVLNSFLA
ncbi:hypothetical protein APHNP_0480 [Anaplasma phagocytophilum str. ApNP]|uniref:Uncharacterized protein n=1 Tax=Anaplasma phagocytophilum str. ApNP TaxID=1359153 RepID=A0A0F3NL29_ANAPH|nr:hypothetical protein APHNP_0480 [Anaplasma phagocytophilum str. ApNP]